MPKLIKLTLADYILSGLQNQQTDQLLVHCETGPASVHIDGNVNLVELAEWIEIYRAASERHGVFAALERIDSSTIHDIPKTIDAIRKDYDTCPKEPRTT